MDEDWDDGISTTADKTRCGVASDGGRKFMSGRGFKAAEDTGGWDDNSSGFNGAGAAKTDTWDDAPAQRDNYGGNRGRGGGRSGGRGRGGGRGGYQNDRNNDNGGGDNDGGWGDAGTDNKGWGDSEGKSGRGWGSEDSGGRGRGRGRGGRGGGRGGGRRDDGGFGDNEDGRKNDGENGEEVKKEMYIPPERADEDLFTSTITSGINFVKLDDIEVNVSGEDVPPSIQSFETSGLRPFLLENVKKSGYIRCTPIQKYAIPIILKGRDIMGCAQTGSGKTAAFLLPIINQLIASNEGPVLGDNCCQPKAIIVSPTRELAIQIHDQSKKFAHNTMVKTVVAYGGVYSNYQKNHILNGCHILVATPGRLNDFVKRGYISFASVQYFVLDEADRMLDMGFLPTVEQMLGDSTMVATGDRQTLMFSATFPEEVQQLAGKFLHNYIFVAVGIVGSASTDVEQVLYQIGKFQKREKLVQLLREAKGKEKTVVFVETKRMADFLATYLSENDISTTSIHGDRLQRQREEALWDFKKGIHNILVATAVAARGLDIEGIHHVINFDLPNNIDEYVHRIGRTGRVGNRGKASSFFDPEHDSAIATGLAKILKQAGQEVPDWLSSGGFAGGRGDAFGGRDIRGEDFGRAQNFNTQPAEQEDEEW